MKSSFCFRAAEWTLESLLTIQPPPVPYQPVFLADTDYERLSRRAYLQDALTDVNHALYALSDTQKKLDTIREILRQRQALLLNVAAPVMSLPTELLQTIFQWVVSGQTRPRSRLIISQVCARWRVVSIGFRQLWNAIEISHPGQGRMVEEFGRRSCPFPLDVNIKLAYNWPGQNFSIPITPDIAKRIASLFCDSPRGANVLIFPPKILPTLSTVTLSSNGISALSLDINEALQSTRTLHLRGVFIGGQTRISFPLLEYLSFGSMECMDVTNSLHSIYAPLLVHLELCKISLSGVPDDHDIVQNVFHQLNKLTVRDCPVGALDHICGDSILPNIRSLELETVSEASLRPERTSIHTPFRDIVSI